MPPVSSYPYVNSTPESVPVVVNNNTFNVSLGGVEAKWKDLYFTLGNSSGGTGLIFVMVEGAVYYEIIDAEEVKCFIDNVAQPKTTYTINGARTTVTLDAPLEGTLRVHALVKEV